MGMQAGHSSNWETGVWLYALQIERGTSWCNRVGNPLGDIPRVTEDIHCLGCCNSGVAVGSTRLRWVQAGWHSHGASPGLSGCPADGS